MGRTVAKFGETRDTFRRQHRHVTGDAVVGTFVNNHVVERAVGGSEDDVRVGVVVQTHAFSVVGVGLAHLGQHGVRFLDEHVVMLAHKFNILLHKLFVFRP